MDYAESESLKMVRRTARDVADSFGGDYVREHVREKTFPREFSDALAENGFYGAMIDEEYGGAAMGMLEMSVILEELSRGGTPGSLLLVLTSIFGALGIDLHGTEDQKQYYLPRIADGELQFCMALTEPNAGVNALNVETYAEQEGDEYVVNGQKVFISGVDHADGMLLIARTSPFDEENPTHGISLFLVPEPSEQDGIELTPLDMGVPWFERQFEIQFNDLRVGEDRILGGPDNRDEALYQLFDTLNTERIAGAASAVGAGLRAIDEGVDYANDRRVFGGHPIGSHQAIQHPLAQAYAELIAAREMVYKASWKFDRGEECGLEANTANLLSSEASHRAADRALQTHGGSGFSNEYSILGLWINTRLSQTAPIPNEMIRNFIAEHELGLPKSYSW